VVWVDLRPKSDPLSSNDKNNTAPQPITLNQRNPILVPSQSPTTSN